MKEISRIIFVLIMPGQGGGVVAEQVLSTGGAVDAGATEAPVL